MEEIEKELKRNERLRELISKELDRDKKQFAQEIRKGMGKQIVEELNDKKENDKKSFWEKIKLLFT